jgi:hypothetical protein
MGLARDPALAGSPQRAPSERGHIARARRPTAFEDLSENEPQTDVWTTRRTATNVVRAVKRPRGGVAVRPLNK